MPYALCPMHVGYLMLLRKAIAVFITSLPAIPSISIPELEKTCINEAFGRE